MKIGLFVSISLLIVMLGCNQPKDSSDKKKSESQVDTNLYTPLSRLPNSYVNFHSPHAINHLAEIENQYFRSYKTGLSPYYGTIWRETSENRGENNLYSQFTTDLGSKGDSMHCTIYAVEALQAGMGINFEKLEKSHKRIWNKREHAGWSIGYLLVKEWNWKAYLIIDRESQEFDQCLKSFKQKKEYPVWRQPNIPLENVFIRGEQDSLIQDLLLQHEFG